MNVFGTVYPVPCSEKNSWPPEGSNLWSYFLSAWPCSCTNWFIYCHELSGQHGRLGSWNGVTTEGRLRLLLLRSPELPWFLSSHNLDSWDTIVLLQSFLLLKLVPFTYNLKTKQKTLTDIFGILEKRLRSEVKRRFQCFYSKTKHIEHTPIPFLHLFLRPLGLVTGNMAFLRAENRRHQVVSRN